MDVLAGPAAAAAVLLVIGGAPKAAAPADTARALRALRVPVGALAVRGVGIGEVAVGLGFLVAPGRLTAALVGAAYTAFTAVVALALRSGQPLATCGCFGGTDTPPTVIHLALVAVTTLTMVGYAVSPATGLLPDGALASVAFAALVGTVAWFGYLVMSRLAVLQQVRR